jgi:hypothetical protein
VANRIRSIIEGLLLLSMISVAATTPPLIVGLKRIADEAGAVSPTQFSNPAIHGYLLRVNNAVMSSAVLLGADETASSKAMEISAMFSGTLPPANEGSLAKVASAVADFQKLLPASNIASGRAIPSPNGSNLVATARISAKAQRNISRLMQTISRLTNIGASQK